MTDTTIVITGGITADPQDRGRDGKAWVTFDVASTPRRLNRDTNQWEDGTPTYWACSANNKLAEAILQHCRKGTRVVLTGTAASRSWEKDGQTHSRVEVQVQNLGIVPRAGDGGPPSAYVTPPTISSSPAGQGTGTSGASSTTWHEPGAYSQPQTPEPTWQGQPTSSSRYDEDTPF